MASGERNELRGQVVDSYRVGPRIGLGGTGVVFEVEHLPTGRSLVMKTLRPCFLDHPDLGRRLSREAEVSRTVRHPGIVPVLDEGRLVDGSPYVVMERAHGESLARLLLRVGVLEGPEAAAIAVRVCAILHAGHQLGYVHRDVKPEHILLEPDRDGRLSMTLLDYGVCAAPTQPAEERAREQGRVFGTPSYVSPEQASGRIDIDGRADLFSLGIVLYESLAGHLPFRASNVANLLLRIIREEAPPLCFAAPHVDRSLEACVTRALARDPEQRWPSARALARALVPHCGDRLETERRLVSMLRLGHATEGLPRSARENSRSTVAAA